MARSWRCSAIRRSSAPRSPGPLPCSRTSSGGRRAAYDSGMFDIPARLGRVRAELQEQQLDALLVSQPDNRRYLSGFTGSAGYLLISARAALLLSDFRYLTQGPEQ